jgi:hypothetical protein
MGKLTVTTNHINVANQEPSFHQDLKLENILYIEPPNSSNLPHDSSNDFDQTFKVADLGLCHFKVGVNNSLIYAPDVQGTKTYGMSSSSS